MRSQTSVTLVSLLIASVAVGLQQVEYRLSGLKTLFVQPFIPSDSYLCHRGSGRFENKPTLPLAAHA
ncbi:MAG: hypothetical protein HC780_03575 [Leptolyngbyaceae cyanobacterium CSU_1_3]|nr:hypothetical protein [Leptolyngbyaceae cyanobacterium CSU_1_3]